MLGKGRSIEWWCVLPIVGFCPLQGSEIIRLYHTLLGPEGFRKGMDLYFKRHDGQVRTASA